MLALQASLCLFGITFTKNFLRCLKNDRFHFVETCRFLVCYRDEKDFFDILRIIALKLTNIEYDILKEFIIIIQT